MKNLSVGDKVVIKRGTEDWVEEMNDFIGKTVTVSKVFYKDGQVLFWIEGESWTFDLDSIDEEATILERGKETKNTDTTSYEYTDKVKESLGLYEFCSKDEAGGKETKSTDVTSCEYTDKVKESLGVYEFCSKDEVEAKRCRTLKPLYTKKILNLMRVYIKEDSIIKKKEGVIWVDKYNEIVKLNDIAIEDGTGVVRVFTSNSDIISAIKEEISSLSDKSGCNMRDKIRIYTKEGAVE